LNPTKEPSRSSQKRQTSQVALQRLCDWKLVEGGEFIPPLPPAIDLSVRYVEDFIACFYQCFSGSGHDNSFQVEQHTPRLFRNPPSGCKLLAAFVCHYRVEVSDSDRCS